MLSGNNGFMSQNLQCSMCKAMVGSDCQEGILEGMDEINEEEEDEMLITMDIGHLEDHKSGILNEALKKKFKS